MFSEDALDNMTWFKSSLVKLMMSLVAKPFLSISLCMVLASSLTAFVGSMFFSIIGVVMTYIMQESCKINIVYFHIIKN